MKTTFSGLLLLALVASAGCGNKDTAGGPGASDPDYEKPVYGQSDNTFNLTAPSTSLKQEETKAVVFGIKRGKNFQDNVTLKFTDVPQGVTLEPASPVIKHGETETKVDLVAADDGSLGDFTIKAIGHPTKGAESSSEFHVTVSKDPDVVAAESRDAYADEMQAKFDALDVKFEALEASAANAEGEAKEELSTQVELAKEKRDDAEKKLAELRKATPGTWETFKEGVSKAFDDLATMLG